jgi:hypothetical protein
MNKADLDELSRLFEKVVDDKADVTEQKQLELLYQVFITEGREGHNNVVPFSAGKKVG